MLGRYKHTDSVKEHNCINFFFRKRAIRLFVNSILLIVCVVNQFSTTGNFTLQGNVCQWSCSKSGAPVCNLGNFNKNVFRRVNVMVFFPKIGNNVTR